MADVGGMREVFVSSTMIPRVGEILTEAIEASDDYRGKIQVKQLHLTGFYGNVSMVEEDRALIPRVEILMGDPDAIGIVFSHPDSKLKWAQSTNAGAEKFFQELQKTKTQKVPNFIFTRRADIFPRQMAEYVIGRIIFRERYFDVIHENQMAKKYGSGHTELRRYRTLNELSLGIIGCGTIGKEVAKKCKAFDMTVWTAVRDERYEAMKTENQGTDYRLGEHFVDHVRPMSKLSEMLSSCDYVVSILPFTSSTTNLLSGDVLKACQNKKSVFLNVGRGNVIDDDSLVHALKSGWLGGAILDVFNTEPLPPSSPLWTLPGVTITPHVSATMVFSDAEVSAMFLANLRLYDAGKPLNNKVDFNKGY